MTCLSLRKELKGSGHKFATLRQAVSSLGSGRGNYKSWRRSDTKGSVEEEGEKMGPYSLSGIKENGEKKCD